MKMYRFAALALAAFLACTPAVAQWQVPDHSVPIGNGSGVQGFNAAAPGTAGNPLVSNGAGADPTFQPLSASSVLPAPTRAGDIVYWNGATWVTLPGNNSGTQLLSENGSGVPNWIPSSASTPLAFGGRLTLTSSTPVTTTDVTGATSIFYAPFTGSVIPIYNGTSFVAQTFTASASDTVGLTVTLGSSWGSGQAYDWFVGLNTGTVTLCSGPAWTNAGAGTSTRGTGAGTTELQMINGIWTNKNVLTCRFNNSTTFSCAVNQCSYVGTTLMTGAGATEDSAAKRLTYNQYNQSPRRLRSPVEATASWTYTTATWRQANANTANQVSVFAGFPGTLADLRVDATGDTSAATSFMAIGIGVNTAASVADVNQTGVCSSASNASKCALSATLKAYPALGLTNYLWSEASAPAAGTTTFYGQGVNSGIIYLQAGLAGSMLF